MYSVARRRTVLPLQPGASCGASSLDFVPHFSFAEYDPQIGRAPDVIAIPWFESGYSAEGDAAVLDGHLATVNTGWFDDDVSLRDLARTHSGTLARAVADSLSYTAACDDFSGASLPISAVLAGAALCQCHARHAQRERADQLLASFLSPAACKLCRFLSGA